MTIENREYKSDVFSMLMEDKKNALEVYNALNSSSYDDPDQVEIVNLEKGISLSIRNDAAFIVDTYISIYEHQSSYNPNMPLRSLIYYVEILEKRLENRDLFSSRRIEIPTPHFAVFYNGVQDRPEREVLKLSASYSKQTDNPELELICTVYNINPDKDRELLSKCEVLEGYTFFVEAVRKFREEDSETPVKDAIDYCISKHVLEDFFTRRGTEVLKNMALDMTFERREELIRKEEREIGNIDGKKEGKKEEQIILIQKKVIKNKTLDTIADELESTIDEIKPLYEAVIKYPTDTDPKYILAELN